MRRIWCWRAAIARKFLSSFVEQYVACKQIDRSLLINRATLGQVMKRKALFVFFATLNAFLLGGPSVAVAQLELVSARDHIEGAFTTSASGTADKKFVFLASALSGTLFVLENDEKKNFPLAAQIPVSQFPLFSVTTDDKSVFTAGADGTVRAFDNKPPFLLKQTLSVSPYGVFSLSSINRTLYASQGQGVNASN